MRPGTRSRILLVGAVLLAAAATAGVGGRPEAAPLSEVASATVVPEPTLPGRTPRPEPTPQPTIPAAVVNVRDHGAKADGSDDTAAFEAALQAASRRGAAVFVPDGVYAVRRLVVPDGAAIRGQSRDGTVLQRLGLGRHADGGFIHIEAVANVSIADLTLRGTGRRLEDTGELGRGDDILINVIDSRNVQARNLSLEDSQGCGIQIEGSGTSEALFEDISITNTFVRDNGYHGVALWAYRGTHHSTFRRITIDGADYAGIMIDAGTEVGPAAGVDDNVFEDIVIRNAARYHVLNGGHGAGWIWTGGERNVVARYEISDIAHGAALVFGADQSGIGSSENTLTDGRVMRIASGIIASFGGAGETVYGTEAILPQLLSAALP